MIEYIDEEEKEIIESLRTDSWISDFYNAIKKTYEEYASNILILKTKSKSI